MNYEFIRINGGSRIIIKTVGQEKLKIKTGIKISYKNIFLLPRHCISSDKTFLMIRPNFITKCLEFHPFSAYSFTDTANNIMF